MADGTRDDNMDVVPTQRFSESGWAGRVLLADTGRYSSQGGLQTGRSAITDAYNRSTSLSGFTPRPEQPIPDPKLMAGAPTSKDEQKPPTVKSVGSTGTQIFGGIIAQTQEYNEDFYWRAAIDVYEQMRRTDGQVAAILTMLYLPIERADWGITPASDDPADVELASFVKSALFDDLVYVTTAGRTVRQAWQSIIQQVLTMLPFGFSVFAKWWRIDEEGFVKLARLEPILQRTLWRWWPGADNQLVGVQQRGFRNWQIVYEDIHADALLLFVNRQEGSNYDGWSVLRAAYKHWYYLDVFYRLQGIGIEKHTFMPPIGILSELANSTEDANALFEQIKNIRTADSNGLVVPHGSSVEFPKGIQRGQGQDVEFAIHHHDDKIARAVLASFVSMGSNETGTFALADVLVRTFYDTLQGVLEYICGVFNAELIPHLVNYNFRGVKIYPKLTGGSVRRLDMGDITALLPYLNGDSQLEDWLRKLVGAPMAPKSAVNTTNPSGGQPDGNGRRPQGNDLSGGKNAGGRGQNTSPRGSNDARDGNSGDSATDEGADGGADADGGGALSEVALLADALESLGLVDAVARAEAHGRTLLSNPYPRGPHGHYGEGGEHGMHSHVGEGLRGHGGEHGGHNQEHATGPHEGEKVGGGRKAGGGTKRGGGGKAAKAPKATFTTPGHLPETRTAAMRAHQQWNQLRDVHRDAEHAAEAKLKGMAKDDPRHAPLERLKAAHAEATAVTTHNELQSVNVRHADAHIATRSRAQYVANQHRYEELRTEIKSAEGALKVAESGKGGRAKGGSTKAEKGAGKTEKAPAEDIHARAARGTKAPRAKEPKGLPQHIPAVGHVHDEALLNPYGPANPHVARILYGEHQVHAALNRYSTDKLREAAAIMRRQYPDERAPAARASKAKLVDYLATHAKADEGAAREFLNTYATHQQAIREELKTKADRAFESEPLHVGAAKAQAAQDKAMERLAARRGGGIRLTPVGTIRDGRLLDPYAPTNPHALRVIYGDHQLHAALGRYSQEKLREATGLMQRQLPGTKPAKRTKAGLIDYLAAHAQNSEDAAHAFFAPPEGT